MDSSGLTASLNSTESLFLSHSGSYWLSYLSIFGPAEPLHFLACALIFTSPSRCPPPHISPLHVSVLIYPPFPSNASFYHLLLHFLSRPKHIFLQDGLAVALWRAVDSWDWHIFFSWSFYQRVRRLPFCLCVIISLSFCLRPLCGSTLLFMFCSLVTSLFVVPRNSKCFW